VTGCDRPVSAPGRARPVLPVPGGPDHPNHRGQARPRGAQAHAQESADPGPGSSRVG